MAWFDRGNPPEVRLLRFDAWARGELAKRLDWAWAGEAKERRIEQCRIQLHTVCKHLFRRGWNLDGERLAARIEALLDSVAKYQRGGKVLDFWSYYKAAVDRYVGANAEELREEAMQCGAHVSQLFASIKAKVPAGPSMPELVAQREDETLRARVSRQRAREAKKAGDAGQVQLF